jgi:hypothetical protein
MQPHEAFALIDSAMSAVQANRETHVKIQEAMRVLAIAAGLVEAPQTKRAEPKPKAAKKRGRKKVTH